MQMTFDLTNPIFTNEEVARQHFESVVWPNGPVCPHCGVIGNATELKGESTRPGLYKCKDCRKPFTATIGTLYERSHIPLHKWLLATHLLCSSKKGMSAHQLWRTLGFGSYRTAWFMAHRIREGTREGHFGPLGGEGKFVEADETFTGGRAKNRAYKAPSPKEGGLQRHRKAQCLQRLRQRRMVCLPEQRYGVRPVQPAQAAHHRHLDGRPVRDRRHRHQCRRRY